MECPKGIETSKHEPVGVRLIPHQRASQDTGNRNEALSAKVVDDKGVEPTLKRVVKRHDRIEERGEGEGDKEVFEQIRDDCFGEE